MYKEYFTSDLSFHLEASSHQVRTDNQELMGWCVLVVLPRLLPATPPLTVALVPVSVRLRSRRTPGAQHTVERLSTLVCRHTQSHTHCSLRSGRGQGPAPPASGNCAADRQ